MGVSRSSACAIQSKTAQSHGHDPHAVVARPKLAQEHGLHSGARSTLSVGGLTCRQIHVLLKNQTNEPKTSAIRFFLSETQQKQN